DDYGQKDILLLLYQAGRRIFSWIRNDEKCEVAENNYLVKQRKLHYIKDYSGINKNIDVLLVSGVQFDMGSIAILPETVIFLNCHIMFENTAYQKDFDNGAIKVYKKH